VVDDPCDHRFEGGGDHLGSTRAARRSSVRVVSVPVSEAHGSRVSIRMPSHPSGVVDVELCTATGCSRADPRVDSFSYQP